MRRFFEVVLGVSITALSLAACTSSAGDGADKTESEVNEASKPTGTTLCDKSRVACRMAEPQCPAGQTPSVTADPNVPGSVGCWGPCVEITSCAPTATNLCDKSRVACRMAEPQCPAGQTPSVTDGSVGCWGPCVEVTSCRCEPNGGSTQCPDGYTCWGTHLACGPYVR